MEFAVKGPQGPFFYWRDTRFPPSGFLACGVLPPGASRESPAVSAFPPELDVFRTEESCPAQPCPALPGPAVPFSAHCDGGGSAFPKLSGASRARCGNESFSIAAWPGGIRASPAESYAPARPRLALLHGRGLPGSPAARQGIRAYPKGGILSSIAEGSGFVASAVSRARAPERRHVRSGRQERRRLPGVEQAVSSAVRPC
jgi:hypothetical protein